VTIQDLDPTAYSIMLLLTALLLRTKWRHPVPTTAVAPAEKDPWYWWNERTAHSHLAIGIIWNSRLL